MKDFELMELLGRAFADGKTDVLADQLAPDCRYVSEYAEKTIDTAENILKHMKAVYDHVEDDCGYSFKSVPIAGLLRGGGVCPMDADQNVYLADHALLLFQFDTEHPCAVVSVMRDRKSGLIKSILLSRNSRFYNVSFFDKELLKDSPLDLPSTVTPMTPRDAYANVIRNMFSGQHLDDKPEEISGEAYIWKKADEFIKPWLESEGYEVLESRPFDDCIGYRCSRNDYDYTVYMFAYGNKKTALLDGDYCRKLLDYEFSADSTVLVVYLKVKRMWSGSETVYKVGHYSGVRNREPDLWRVNSVDGRNILEYFLSRETTDAIYEFMYAFNHDSLDVYDSIITDEGPAFQGIGFGGSFMNSGFYTSLNWLHEQYGNMKIGYVRYNDVIYSFAPYLEGYGFFRFSFDDGDWIAEVTAYPFDGRDVKTAEFIRTDERESESMYDAVPQLTGVYVLPAVYTERFALKLLFENGECRKYVLPIPSEDEEKEVIQYRKHLFTDGIWQSAEVRASLPAEIKGYPDRKSAVVFKNGFFISGLLCYMESTPFAEAEKCSETVYEDDRYRLTRIWRMPVNSVREDKETGLLELLISGTAFNGYGLSTFASVDGDRLTSIDFDYMDGFSDGLARVSKSGYGYGFVDEQMHFIIPMIYGLAEDFKDGQAKVMRGGKWFYIDKTGKETPVESQTEETKYQEIGNFSEGMCKVSILKLSHFDLAFHSDYDDIAGTWGFVNEAGEEVIAPQYIYAEDFSNGIAVVCKGKWTIDPKWDNECNSGRYWTDEELWGAIDKNGKTAIPFVFDEIKHFNDAEEVFMAHYGGWEDGHWGVIDARGNWLAEPVFEDIDYEYHNGLFTFYEESRRCGDDVLLGIYDINRHRVIFEPQFYDVSFCDDEWIKVNVFDEKLGRRIEKLIDPEGKERFPSTYSFIDTSEEPYVVTIIDDKGERRGLIDGNGNIILPCEYSDVDFDGFDYEHKWMIFTQDEKLGVSDFSGTVILPPVYYRISNTGRFFTVRAESDENDAEGLVDETGREILPCIYKRISWFGDNHLLCKRSNCCEMMVLTEKKKG
ncbi:MAG: WG repeat-containing protein [Synergistes sp.]|nr:WG repeat-containing protein [Synergistes sp.]